MKNLLILLFLFSLVGNVKAREKLKIEINKNVELLGFAYFIGFEGAELEKKKESNHFGLYFYQKYKSYASSENLAKAFSVSDHLWLDYLLGLLLQVEDFPNAKLPLFIEEHYFINFSKNKNIDEARLHTTNFLDGLNAFYKEINFDEYLSQHQEHYNATLQQVRQTLPDDRFIPAMEKFYKKDFDRYILVPSLTIPKGMGFGLKISNRNQSTVLNVFGTFEKQIFLDTNKLDMGFGNAQRLRELSIHEFGHSFVNPVIDEIPKEKIASTEKLFPAIKPEMVKQNYSTWKTCLYEHFVRAGEVVIAKMMGDKDGAEKLRTHYIETRNFKYLPVIISELDQYAQGKHPSYLDTVLRSMDELMKIE